MLNIYERRVARGAAYLDAIYPGWVDRLDLTKLNVDDRYRCVLAQVVCAHGWSLVGNFYATIEAYNGHWWLLRRGFTVPGCGFFSQFLLGARGSQRFKSRRKRLEQAWRDYLVKERMKTSEAAVR